MIKSARKCRATAATEATKSYRVASARIAAAQKILGTATAIETIDAALDLVVLREELPTAKLAVQAALARLPDTASWEEIMYAFYVVERVHAGLHQASSGETLSHAEVRERLGALRTS